MAPSLRRIHSLTTLAALWLQISCVLGHTQCAYHPQAGDGTGPLLSACPGLTVSTICQYNPPVCTDGVVDNWTPSTNVSLPDGIISVLDCCNGTHPGILEDNGSVVLVASTPSPSSSLSPSPPPQSPTVSSPQPSPTPSSTTGGGGGGTNKGLIIGVTVGSVAAVLILAAIMGFCVWRRRKRRDMRPGSDVEKRKAAKPLDINQLPRVALVIGVQNYNPKHIPKLEAVADDVYAMAELLKKKGGFQVTVSIDPEQRQLSLDFEEEINKRETDGGCVAVLYYSGHGLMDQESSHYMLPKDWDTSRGLSTALEFYGCKLEGPKGALSRLAGAKAAVALFDACRSLAVPGSVKGPQDVALASSGWRGPINSAGTGAGNLLVAYGCAPKATAQEGRLHGRYTAAVLQYLCDGLTVNEAVSAVYDTVVEESSYAQEPESVSRRPAVFDKLRLGMPHAPPPGNDHPEQC